jgi:protein-disulfide isomerase
MKKVLLTILALFCFIPFVSAKKEPVKVYIFEAGGCPYCEAEIEYLKGLSSYNKKFVIVQKEAYVDHVDWAQGKDFELAQKVADAFKAAGFQDATYQATPFVVISDLYAAAAYSTELESVIEEAYEKGDKDIVTCIEKGKTNCLKHLTKNSDSESSGEFNTSAIVVILCTLALGILYFFKSSKDTKEIVEALQKRK